MFIIVFCPRKRLDKVMDSAKTFCLKSDKFPDILIQSFKALRSGRDFADVTLACEDGQLVESHKLVLSSTSTFFANILGKMTCSNPVIYLKDVSMSSLEALLDFVYTGEVEVAEGGVEEFLSLAEHLQILGLSSKGEPEQKESDDLSLSHEIENQSGFEVKIERSGDPPPIVPEIPREIRKHGLEKDNLYHKKRGFKSSVKNGSKDEMKREDSKNTTFVQCDQCDQILKNRAVLNGHIRRQHPKKSLSQRPIKHQNFVTDLTEIKKAGNEGYLR